MFNLQHGVFLLTSRPYSKAIHLNPVTILQLLQAPLTLTMEEYPTAGNSCGREQRNLLCNDTLWLGSETPARTVILVT